MPLSQSQKAIWEKARSVGSGGQAVRLSDETCSYLIARIAIDIGVQDHFPEIPDASEIPDFFNKDSLSELILQGLNAYQMYEKLLKLNADSDMYFACLSSLHKARLKYEIILETQSMPTLEQVGPRGLLQYGKVTPTALAGFMFWRKWFFDVDNRAGQETGYLFEPVIANAVGGTPVSSTRSPVRRHKNNKKGRQVDCLLGNKAYEIKIRLTIAASGQGRWGEELDFPLDCEESGFQPVLLILDGTPNTKMTELANTFLKHGGEVYIGEAAWEHLDELAGKTMSLFLDKYVRAPIANLIEQAPKNFPDFRASIDEFGMKIQIDDEIFQIKRGVQHNGNIDRDVTPDDD